MYTEYYRPIGDEKKSCTWKSEKLVVNNISQLTDNGMKRFWLRQEFYFKFKRMLVDYLNFENAQNCNNSFSSYLRR